MNVYKNLIETLKYKREDIERTIEKSVMLQPFVKSISVSIKIDGHGNASFRYMSLLGDSLYFNVTGISCEPAKIVPEHYHLIICQPQA